MEDPDSGCQDKLTHLSFSFSHPEGTSSPEKRGHSDADAATLQLDAHLPVLVERRLRPLPVTFGPTRRSSPSRAAAGGHLGCGRKSFPQAYAKRLRSDPEPDSLPVCAGTPGDSAPSEVLMFFRP